jgi:hypothetical protein
MLPDIKYLPINWVDGMKISSRDFISMENALSDSVRDAQALRLNGYNYGLLPANQSDLDHYPKLVYDTGLNQLVLTECRALTPGGQRIEITQLNHERKKYPAELPAVSLSGQEPGHYDVYIHQDTAVRLGAGEFAHNNPPRHLSVSPKYELSLRLHDGSYIEQESFLKISELEVRDGQVEVLSTTGQYLPPSTTLSALAVYRRIHAAGEERLKAMVQHHLNFINRMGVDTKNEVAQEAITLSEKIVTPILSSASHYSYILPDCAPVFTVAYFKDFARLVKFQLDHPFRAGIINQFKPELLDRLATLERTEPRQAAMHLPFTRIMLVLEELEKFLAELSKHNYHNQTFDLYDHNRLAPGYKPPLPVVAAPEEQRPAPQPAEPTNERIF